MVQHTIGRASSSLSFGLHSWESSFTASSSHVFAATQQQPGVPVHPVTINLQAAVAADGSQEAMVIIRRILPLLIPKRRNLDLSRAGDLGSSLAQLWVDWRIICGIGRAPTLLAPPAMIGSGVLDLYRVRRSLEEGVVSGSRHIAVMTEGKEARIWDQ